MSVFAAVLATECDEHIAVAASKVRRQELAWYSDVRDCTVQSNGMRGDVMEAGVQVVLQGARPG